MKIEYAKCEKCGQMVELNGAGSTANIWQRGLTKAINFLYPISQKLFRPCANWHDMAYHQGAFEGTPNQARILADAEFHRMCLAEIENPTRPDLTKVDRFFVRWNKWWFKYQANKYYLALKIGGEGVYPLKNCLDSSRKEPLK